MCVCVCVFYSLLTNTVVQTYNAGKPVWSCCWCLDNSNYVYAGLSNGSVLVYDTRDTSTHVQELQPLRSRYTHTHTHTHTYSVKWRSKICAGFSLVFAGSHGDHWSCFILNAITCGSLQVSSGVSVLRPTGSIQLVSLWWADRRLSGGRVFLGAGQRDHVQTACPAAGDGRLHWHPSGNGEPTLSGHLQARWETRIPEYETQWSSPEWWSGV